MPRSRRGEEITAVKAMMVHKSLILYYFIICLLFLFWPANPLKRSLWPISGSWCFCMETNVLKSYMCRLSPNKWGVHTMKSKMDRDCYLIIWNRFASLHLSPLSCPTLTTLCLFFLRLEAILSLFGADAQITVTSQIPLKRCYLLLAKLLPYKKLSLITRIYW